MRISTRNFKKSIRNSILLLILLVFSSCGQRSEKAEQTEPDLFTGFQNPPAEARSFVRWWWNGNRIEKEEIVRQLDVLHKAGIGGVEINPIAMPEEADDMGIEPLIWNSKEWNEMLRFAALEAQKRGMLTDLIVGSGWPFGGEFLEEDETIQRIIVHQIPCSGGEKLNENLESLYHNAVSALTHSYGAARSYELVFIRLVPSGIQSTAEILDLTETFHKEK